MHAANYGLGTVLRSQLDCPVYDCEAFSGVPFVETAAVLNEDKSELVIFAVNRSLDETVEFDIETQGLVLTGTQAFSEISGHDKKAVNTKDNGAVKPHEKSLKKAGESIISAELAPLSWNMIRAGVKD